MVSLHTLDAPTSLPRKPMIESIRLQNHEAHKALSIQFTPQLNVIVGRTDAGKSSILRAISWVARHESLGSRITHGESTLRVGIKTALGSVVRFRSSEGYGYKAGGNTFLACAQNQPKEVADILQLTDINIQLQHDAPFLLGLTPGKLAEAINSVVDLSSIDKCSTWLKSQRTKTNALLESAEAKKKALAEQVGELFWVDQAKEDMESLKTLGMAYEKSKDTGKALEFLVIGVRDRQEAIVRLSRLQDALQDHETQASVTQGGLHRTKARKQGLRSVVDALGECSRLSKLEAAQSSLVRLVGIEKAERSELKRLSLLNLLVLDLRGIPEKISRLSSLEAGIRCMITAQATAGEAGAKKKTLDTIIQNTKEVQHEAIQLIKEKESVEQQMGVCSECGRPLKKTQPQGDTSEKA